MKKIEFMVRDNVQYWCLKGKLHREDGPAVIWPNGSQRWLLHGEFIKSNKDENNSLFV